MTWGELRRLFSPARWALIGVVIVCAAALCWLILTE